MSIDVPLQAKELAKIRAEEEEERKLAERARIEREAAAQRAAHQKKKEAQARKKAIQESKQTAKTAAKTRSTPSAVRPKNTKSSRFDMAKIAKQHQTTIVTLCAAAAVCGAGVLATWYTGF